MKNSKDSKNVDDSLTQLGPITRHECALVLLNYLWMILTTKTALLSLQYIGLAVTSITILALGIAMLKQYTTHKKVSQIRIFFVIISAINYIIYFKI